VNTQTSEHGGFVYAHIFENEAHGIARGLFWNIFIQMAANREEGSFAIQSLSCEWLSFPVGPWSQLCGLTLADCIQPNLVECTVYRDGEHHWVQLEDLRILAVEANGNFEIELVGSIPAADAGTEADLNLTIGASLPFQGIFVVPSNLKPPPSTPLAASEIVQSFTDIGAYEAPVWDRFRYVFRPRL